MQEEVAFVIQQGIDAIERLRVSIDELKDDFGKTRLETNKKFLTIENKFDRKFDTLKSVILTITTIFSGSIPVIIFLVKINFIKVGF